MPCVCEYYFFLFNFFLLVKTHWFTIVATRTQKQLASWINFFYDGTNISVNGLSYYHGKE